MGHPEPMGGRLHPAVAAVRLAVRTDLRRLNSSRLSSSRLDPDRPVLVACSGGADSTALAAAVAFEAPRLGLTAGAVTVDHGLQPGSAQRAAAVAELLRRLGLAPVQVCPVEVAEGHRAGGLEAAARQARYAALTACAERTGAAAVLLGHTRDDQAETVLLGLARGSGARSLAGMRPVGGPGGRYRRPLLDLPRTLTRDACRAEGLPVWDDPHNADDRFTRVRVRRRLLPLLEAELGPGVAAALARTATQLRDDADALDALAADRLAQLTNAADVTAVTAGATAGVPPVPPLPVPAIEAEVPAVRSRLLRAWLRAAGAPATDLTHGHIDAVRALVERWHGQVRVDVPGGLYVARRGHGRNAVLECGRQPRRAGPEGMAG